ncbi:MAG TPA: alcohol dehydrogenase [Candidatus Aminicenantes bacterium]|nr:alcohol dehydrogenase [Candidatus Aminicenantes bacterium]
MRALLFTGSHLELKADFPEPKIKKGEAKIKVLKAGICNTDLEITKGYLGFRGVLGHEFVGVVEEASSPGLLGQRVVGEINLPCGQCKYCLHGQSRHCPSRQVLGIKDKDGVFADYVTLPEKNLHLLPDSLSSDEALFTEPLAAALRIIEQLPPDFVKKKEEIKACVLGDGKLGLLAAQALKKVFPQVSCLGKHGNNLTLLSSWGITTYLNTDHGGLKFDLIVEATGNKEGLNQAVSLVQPEGIIFLKSTLQDDYEGNLSPLVIDEIQIIGSRCGPFPQAIKWLENKRVEVLKMIEAEYTLERAKEAMQRAAQPGALKVILNINSPD